MKIIDYAEHSIPEEDIVVTCHPEVLTGTTSLFVVRAQDFLNDPVWRRDLFLRAKARGGRVLFLESMGSMSEDFQRVWPSMRDQARAVPVKTFSIGGARLSVYLLSPF